MAIAYALFLVFISSGTAIAQKAYESLLFEDNTKKSFTDVNFGYGNFLYSHYHSAPTWIPPYYDPGGPDGCGGYIPAHTDPGYWKLNGSKFQHSSNAFGVGVSHIRNYGSYQRLTLNGTVSGIWDTYHSDSAARNTINTYDFNASVKYDFRFIGASIGFHNGQNILEYESGGYIYSNNDQLSNQTHLTGSLRLGPYDILYGEFRYNDYFPYQLGFRSDYAYQALLGSGFGLKNGSCLEMGFDGNKGLFFSGVIYLNNKYGFKATTYTSRGDNSKYYLYSNQMIQLSMIYRFSGSPKRK